MKDHVRGNIDGAAVLVEYADFECPYCATAYPIVKDLVQRYPQDLAHVFRPFPLVEIHPHAMHAAQAAEAAGNQGAFWEMHDMLFEHHTRLDDRSLIAYATKLHLDLRKFASDFEDPVTIENVKESLRKGLQEGVKGTPTFFLNGVMLELADYGDLEIAVREAIARGAVRGAARRF